MNKSTVAQQTETSNFSPSSQGILQRKCACGNRTLGGGECVGCGKKKLSLQRKLAIGASNDPLEREADRVADQVMAMSAPSATSKAPLRIQRYAGQASESVGDVPASVDRVLASSGRPLESTLRQDMEQRFGHDFSQVRVHSGTAAEQSAREVNAKAYTVGENIVFGEGQSSLYARDGQRLLAHELTHVVQQVGGISLLQRLIRTPYPWRGVITPARGANLRNTPSSRDPSSILVAIPQGETVKVLSSTGNWLKVESRYTGSLLVGYMYHTLVDDATSRSMAASVGTTMVWTPSGPGSGTDFQIWASAPTETPFPAVSATTVMNCWEAVLLSAYRAGSINWRWIHNLYTSVPPASWVANLSRGPTRTYSIPGPNLHMPQRGDIVFFDGLAHVALATGNGSNVYTFWPPPNTPFTPGGTADKVKVFTIESLVIWWAANMPPSPVVEFSAPNW